MFSNAFVLRKLAAMAAASVGRQRMPARQTRRRSERPHRSGTTACARPVRPDRDRRRSARLPPSPLACPSLFRSAEFGNRPQPADVPALLLRCTLVIERDKFFEDFFVGQRLRPTVGLEYQPVELVVQLFEDEDQTLFLNALLILIQRGIRSQLFQHIVHLR